MSKVMFSEQPVGLFVWCVFRVTITGVFFQSGVRKGHVDDSGRLSENFCHRIIHKSSATAKMNKA